jgi:phasin family protein
MEKTMTQKTKQFEKFTGEAGEFGKAGFEAFMKSGTIFAKGFEDIFRTSMTLAQSAAEKQAQYVKDALSSKTLNEWTEAQNKIAQASFDDFMSGATKLTEMSVKLLTEGTEPINEQLGKGIRKASESMAA